MQGGRYVKMSGTNNRNHINLMQIIATASSVDGETTDQVQSSMPTVINYVLWLKFWILG